VSSFTCRARAARFFGDALEGDEVGGRVGAAVVGVVCCSDWRNAFASERSSALMSQTGPGQVLQFRISEGRPNTSIGVSTQVLRYCHTSETGTAIQLQEAVSDL
jgi:hypothetical protein